VLCAVCCVLCAVCCVLCAVCCVLCAVCCVLCAVCCVHLIDDVSSESKKLYVFEKTITYPTSIHATSLDANYLQSGPPVCTNQG
jgi:hypothetical protein